MTAATYVTASCQKVSQLPIVAQGPHGLYVDLEDNQLGSPALAKLGRNITCLNLNSNLLTDCVLPLLKRLRSLTIDGCGMQSFEGMPAFPNLRFLSAANNKLRSFEGLRIFPHLVYVNLSGNPCDFSPVLATHAIGSIYLKTFNDAELTEVQTKAAFALSPLVGTALRSGRDPRPLNSPDEELAASRAFLTADLVRFLGHEQADGRGIALEAVPLDDGDAFVLPWPSKSIRWLRSHSPLRGPEWVPVIRDIEDTTPPHILPVCQLVQMHMVKCEFALGGHTFAIYTDYPVGRKPGHFNLPFPLDPGITGTPIEGSLISMIPLDVPARIEWNCNAKPIAKDCPSIVLTYREVEAAVTCLIEPHSPYFPSLAFSIVYAETKVVEALLPVVSEIAFPDQIVQGDRLNFTRTMFPEREGPSAICIERSHSPSEEWVRIVDLQPGRLQYSPCYDDLDCFLRINYTPVTAEGVKGTTVYSYSSTRVMPALPKFRHAMIGGLPKTFRPLVALGDYFGGQKGNFAVSWFFMKEPFTPDNFGRAKLVAENTIYFTPQAEHGNGYIGVRMIPVREDDVVGETVYTVLDSPLLTDLPPQAMEDAPDEAIKGVTMTFGHTVSWMISDTSAFCGFREVKRGPTFTPKEQHVGQILRILTHFHDHIVGEVQQADPIVRRLSLEYQRPQVGMEAKAMIRPARLFPEHCDILWIKSEGPIERAVALNTISYVFAKEDIGFQIRVRVTPIAPDRRRLPHTESDPTPPIAPEVNPAPWISGELIEKSKIQVLYSREADNILWLRSDVEKKWVSTKVQGAEYQITTADLGKFLRAQLTIGDSILVATSSDTVRALPPSVALAAEKVTVTEGDTIVPGSQYQGGREGDSIVVWKRHLPGVMKFTPSTPTKGKLPRVGTLRMVQGGEGDPLCLEVSRERSYRVTKADVGCLLEFSYTPVRSDFVIGETATLSFGPVGALPPAITNVRIRQNKEGEMEVTGDYSGGEEGASVCEWRVFVDDGRELTISTTPSHHFIPPARFAGRQIQCSYCPVRSDGLTGTPVLSDKWTILPLPALESVEIVMSDMKMAIGSRVRCKAICANNSYAAFQWYNGTGDGKWTRIDSATSADYVCCETDVGLYLLCCVEPVNAQGWRGNSISAATTGSVDSGKVRIMVHKNQYQTGMVMRTNLDQEVIWERETSPDCWDFVCQRTTYLLTSNDIGCRIRAAFEDLDAIPTPRIVLRPQILSFLKATVRARSLKFLASAKMGNVTWLVALDGSGVLMKPKGTGNDRVGRWATMKWEAVTATRDEMVLWLDRSTKFVLIPTFFGVDPRLATAIPEHTRDFILVTMGQFAAAAGVL
jgi:hypothetical protein